MKTYWVSLLIHENENSNPWLCSMQNSSNSIDEALKEIEKSRKTFRVLAAWIDIFDKSEKTTVYHRCYVDSLGNIKK